MTGTNNGSYGVRTQSGTIAVGGGTLTGTGGSGRTSVGVEGALITVTSGGTITGRGGPGGRAHSFGIYTINDIAIGDGCALIGTGGTASNDGGSYGARVPDSESIPDSGNITVTEGGALTLKGQTKVLFSDGSALTANENKQYKYRISNNFASIPTDFTQSGTTPYTHASSYQYVQILPAAHPEPPTGVTLSQTAPKEGVSLTASIAPPEALTFTDTLYNTITAAPRYQWYTNGNATTTDGTPISGATEKSYCPTATDVGKYLYVTVTTYDHFDSVSAATTAKVVPATEAKFNSLSANGSDTASTTELTLTFDQDIVDLKASDVTLTGAQKGTLTRTDTGKYTLGISNITVADGETVAVAVNKAGYHFTPASKTAAVRVYTPPIPTGGGSSGGSTPPQTVQSTNGALWLTGAGLKPSDRLNAEPLAPGAAYNVMLQLAGASDVFAVYDLSLTSGIKSTGSPMTLQCSVGAQYAGQMFTLVHRKADGTVEYFYATVNANGDLAFYPLYELSPFMLVKGTLAQITIPTEIVLDLPKTGDQATAAGYTLMLLAVLAFGAVERRKRTR